ncbi:hypothetical protein [Polynucleobacter antarcticus]|uniref:Uncharacterized protein n=1 Tax=Polynucleobacter antarcticus TaxID=1743162 RepID=A0A6M9Q2I3_9BURK|nr:hypothetical protein [Polynucleobacter antarcticus]QKM62523.1 hypothetical protein DCO16_05250 [Polynucleobacter antarcticus]
MKISNAFLQAVFILVALIFSVPVSALDFSDIAAEGEIKYLKVRPDPGAYSYESRVKITPASLESGSVEIATCHRQLDPIRKVVIVFNPSRIQAIAIQSLDKMASAEVKGNEVVLTDVERGASICIDLRSKALDKVADGQFKLNAGPLMRRYFDGYLPMAAKLRVDWPTDLLILDKTVPSEKDGIQVVQGNDGVQLDMIFAGKMTAQIFLKKSN